MAGTSKVMNIDVGTLRSSREEWATLREGMMSVLAALSYWPFAQGAKLLENVGADVGSFPLNFYPNSSFYMMMQTDGRNRVGSRLEHRFTRAGIGSVTRVGGLVAVRFRHEEPSWAAYGRRARG